VTSGTREDLEELMAQRIAALGDDEPPQLLTIYLENNGTFRVSEKSVIPPHECSCTLARHLAMLPSAIMGSMVLPLVAQPGFWGLMVVTRAAVQVIENGVPGIDSRARMGVIVSRMRDEETLMAILGSDDAPLGEVGDAPVVVAGPRPDLLLHQVLGAMMAICN
jgi:hypothetical protein